MRNTANRVVLLAAFYLLLSASGCGLLRSRYAMEDSVYAAKYADGAERWDLPGKVKQALDARHVGGLSGFYLSGGSQVRPTTGESLGGAELGMEAYPVSWSSARASLAGYAGRDEGFLGLDAGLRLQTPTRFAPFAGVGTFMGGSRGVEVADWDGRDNDDDGLIDERGERASHIDRWLFAVYPEVGAHFWLDSRWRVTAWGRYLVTSEGRKDDDWLLGAQLTLFSR